MATVSLLGLATVSWGADVTGSLGGVTQWDSNVVRTGNNPTSDFIFIVQPRVRLLEEEGKLRWDAEYFFPWEHALKVDRIDGFRHFANVGARYFVTGRTQVFLRDNFSYSEAVSRANNIADPNAPEVNTFDSPVYRNRATVGVQHAFTPRLTGNLAFTNRLFDSTIPNRADNLVYVGNGNLVYSLTQRHQLGGGLAATYQTFDEANNGARPPSQTLFMNFFGSWTWFIDETTTFQITAGPTFVDSNQDAPPTILENQQAVPFVEAGAGYPGGSIGVGNFAACTMIDGQPVAPLGGICPTSSGDVLRQGEDAATDQDISDIRAVAKTDTYQFGPMDSPYKVADTNWTIFGEASLSRRWTPTLVSTLSYQRTDSTASGISGSATLDSVSLINTWQITELWNASLRADFTRRQSVSPTAEIWVVQQQSATGLLSDPAYPLAESTGQLIQTLTNEELDTNRWGVSASLTRRVLENLRVSLRYTYNNQNSKGGSVGRYSDFDDHLVSVGIAYDFDRYNLW